MAFENKVILDAVIQLVGKAKTVKEAYNSVVSLANVEGKIYPTYDEFKAKQNEAEGTVQE